MSCVLAIISQGITSIFWFTTLTNLDNELMTQIKYIPAVENYTCDSSYLALSLKIQRRAW